MMKQGVPVYFPGQAPGAILNDKRIVKIMSETGDTNPVGVKGTVLSSIAMPRELAKQSGCRFAYFVSWDSRPSVPVFVMGNKIAEAET